MGKIAIALGAFVAAAFVACGKDLGIDDPASSDAQAADSQIGNDGAATTDGETEGDAGTTTDANTPADATTDSKDATTGPTCAEQEESCEAGADCCVKNPDIGYLYTCRRNKRCGQCGLLTNNGSPCDASAPVSAVCCDPGTACQKKASDPVGPTRCCWPTSTPCNAGTAGQCCSGLCTNTKCE